MDYIITTSRPRSHLGRELCYFISYSDIRESFVRHSNKCFNFFFKTLPVSEKLPDFVT
jgi:hypothetical protein